MYVSSSQNEHKNRHTWKIFQLQLGSLREYCLRKESAEGLYQARERGLSPCLRAYWRTGKENTPSTPLLTRCKCKTSHTGHIVRRFMCFHTHRREKRSLMRSFKFVDVERQAAVCICRRSIWRSLR